MAQVSKVSSVYASASQRLFVLMALYEMAQPNPEW